MTPEPRNRVSGVCIDRPQQSTNCLRSQERGAVRHTRGDQRPPQHGSRITLSSSSRESKDIPPPLGIIEKVASGWPASRWDEIMPWNWTAQRAPVNMAA